MISPTGRCNHASNSVPLAIIDYDTEDCCDPNDLRQIPQGDGTYVDAYAWVRGADASPMRAAELIEAVIAEEPAPDVQYQESSAP